MFIDDISNDNRESISKMKKISFCFSNSLILLFGHFTNLLGNAFLSLNYIYVLKFLILYIAFYLYIAILESIILSIYDFLYNINIVSTLKDIKSELIIKRP